MLVVRVTVLASTLIVRIYNLSGSHTVDRYPPGVSLAKLAAPEGVG